MPRNSHNTQMFALGGPPPEQIRIAQTQYRLARVFKHDFWAATCLYEPAGGAGERAVSSGIDRVVVKFGRAQSFCGLPLGWCGRWLAAHEEAIYRQLAGIEGVPRWVGRLGPAAYAVEYVDARPLDHLQSPPEGFFDRLAEIFRQIHARGIAYCDANKRSNILVGPAGRPFLVDYQISVRRRDDLPRPLRTIVGWAVRYLASKDFYHLYKHKRRLAPAELRPHEMALSLRRGGLHRLHRKLTKPYRAVRRMFLQRQYARGALKSPTAEMEDHHQPEKNTWRKPHKQ